MGSKFKYALSIVFIGGFVLFFLFSGFLVGLHELPSHAFFHRVELKLFGQYFERLSGQEEPEYYDSIFLRLYRTKTDLSDRIRRDGTGGGMTTFGDAVLLLTHDGQIFNVQSADDVTKTTIRVPDNGYAAYEQVANSEAFKEFNHDLRFLRYNDILFYESEKNRGLAISYTEFDSTGNCYRNTLATISIEPTITSIEQFSASAEDWDIAYRSKPCLPFKHANFAIDGGVAGGRMDFLAPSTIFLGNGDYHWDGIYGSRAIAQDPEGEYGKVMRINLDSRESQIMATGIRNPQGVVLDKNGTLWTVEHGMRGGDELNHIEDGKNYGWPVQTLGTQYSKLPFPAITEASYGHHDTTTYTAPTFAWLPSVAISNLTLIDGLHPSWDGDLLMGSLKDRSLYHIRINDNRVVFSERVEIGHRIRYVHQHTDGRIVLWTDSKRLLFLTGQPYTDNYVEDYLKENIPDEAWRKKVKVAIDACRQCHSIEPGDNTFAPSLASVFDTEIASSDYENYSRALKDKQGAWTAENLRQFLSDPENFAPGTAMPNPGLNDDDMKELINFLEILNERL